MPSGHIYILVNPGLSKDLLNIGMTTRTPEERAREMSKDTGVPGDFFVAYEEAVPNCEYAESIIHERLSAYRYSRQKEFFHLPLKDAIAVVSDVANSIREKAKHTGKEKARPPNSSSNARPSSGARTNTKSTVTAAQNIVAKNDERLTEFKDRVTEHSEKARGDHSFLFAKLFFGGVAVMFLSLFFVPGPAGVFLAGLAAFVGVASLFYFLFFG